MTPQEQAHNVGFTLAEITAITGVARSTLIDWHAHKPKLFDVVLLGCMIKFMQVESSKTVNPKYGRGE